MAADQTIKPRQVGNSTVLTVPANIKLDKNARYFVTKGPNGEIVFMPKLKNPFKDPKLLKQISSQKSVLQYLVLIGVHFVNIYW